VDIFISHSRKNKAIAEEMAQDLAGLGNIWIDRPKKKSGEELSVDIQERIGGADAFILIWSSKAKKSKRVNQEINLALDLGIPLVSCLVDDKKLPKRLRNMMAIPFHDYIQGFGHLNVVLLILNADRLGLDLEGMMDSLDDWESVIDYLDNYLQENDVSGEAAGWIDRVLGTTRAAQAQVSASDDPRIQLRQRLQGQVADHELEAIVEYLFYYNETAGPTLDMLAGISQARASAAGITVVQHLLQYLQNPDDLLPESSHGYFGYIDDAWLIHNTAWRLIEAGILPPATFAVDWGNIQIGDVLVRQLLPPVALNQLENMLLQYLQIIAAEIQAYQPQFVDGNHPYMGEQSTDDRWMNVMTDSLNYL
jgi:hypothetical protein